MNRMFKMLFTLLLGILLIVHTITVNSFADIVKQDKLIELKDMYEKGSITKDEYDAVKRKFSSNVNIKDLNKKKNKKKI